ncbi:MAG: SIMPL domain-containing protein, partial [Thermomicrobiales bacterium]
AADVPDDLIQTTNYSINVVNEFDDNGNLKGVSGYQVTNQVQATITDLDGLGALIDDLVANGANSINGIQFMASDATDALSQARLLAVADAKAKASELAKAAGGKLGEIISISESSIGAGPVAKGGFAAAQDATTTPIQTGSLQIQISVTITYGMN